MTCGGPGLLFGAGAGCGPRAGPRLRPAGGFADVLGPRKALARAGVRLGLGERWVLAGPYFKEWSRWRRTAGRPRPPGS